MSNRKNVVGNKSINELMNISLDSFLSMRRDELAHVVTRLASAANKRLRGLQSSSDYKSAPARKYAEKSGGRFSTLKPTGEKRNLNELRAEYTRVKGFLGMKTSSKRGYKRVTSDMLKRLGAPKDTSVDLINAFWKVYNDMPNRQYFVSGYGQAQKEIFDAVVQVYDPDINYDDESNLVELINAVQNNLQSDYEKNSDNIVNPSDFFEV